MALYFLVILFFHVLSEFLPCCFFRTSYLSDPGAVSVCLLLLPQSTILTTKAHQVPIHSTTTEENQRKEVSRHQCSRDLVLYTFFLLFSLSIQDRRGVCLSIPHVDCNRDQSRGTVGLLRKGSSRSGIENIHRGNKMS